MKQSLTQDQYDSCMEIINKLDNLARSISDTNGDEIVPFAEFLFDMSATLHLTLYETKHPK